MVKASVLLVLVAGCLSDPARPSDGMGGVVFGDAMIELTPDFHPCGTPEAASFMTGASVTAIHSLWVYNGDSSGNDAARLDAAIYDSDGSGNPTSLVASGFVVMQLPSNQWLQLPLATPYTPKPNHVYWIAAMCPMSQGNGFSPVFRYFGPSGAGACDATATQCTQHGRVGESSFDTSWQMTSTFLASTNSYYASSQ